MISGAPKIIVLLCVLVIGCASSPRFTTKDIADDDKFKKELEYSRNAFSKPIDILEADSASLIPSVRPEKENATDQGDRPAGSLPTSNNQFAVQLASFGEKSNASSFLEVTQKKYPNLPVSLSNHDGLWRVTIGSFENRSEAERTLMEIRKQGNRQAWIIRLRDFR